MDGEPLSTLRGALYPHQDLTERIIGLAIEVHRTLRPGLLEAVYLACLCFECDRAGLAFQREVAIPVTYKGLRLPLGFRADLIVAEWVIVEVKAIPALTQAHDAQLLTYMHMSQISIGLLMNFHAPQLVDGLRRLVL